MKINKILFIATLLVVFASNAQIEKGNWMMGGSGSFGNYNTKSLGVENKGTYLNLYPNIGYFFIDKLAVGTNALLSVHTVYSTGYGIGPYVRYYFLEKEKPINVFSELSYNFQTSDGSNDAKFQTFNIKAGTVFFLNNSVGIEVALNYINKKSNLDYLSNNIFLGVGFQIHLERE